MSALRISSSRLRSPSIGTSRPSMLTKLAVSTLSSCYIPSTALRLQACRAGPALDAQIGVDVMRLLLLAGDGAHRALAASTVRSPCTSAGLISGRNSALQRPVRQRFWNTWSSYSSPEISQGGEHRVRRRLAQPAQRTFLHGVASCLQQFQRVSRRPGPRSCRPAGPALPGALRGKARTCRTIRAG